MSLNYANIGIAYYPDPTRGRPVFNGYVYFGEPETDPEILENRIKTYIIQQDGNQIEVPTEFQPYRTGAGGVILYEGSFVQVAVEQNYSLKVLNNKGEQVYFVSNAYEYYVLPTQQTEETITLVDGQRVCEFTQITNESGAFFISSNNADHGRLLKGIDWIPTPETTNSITLTDSFPAGTRLTGIEGDNIGGSGDIDDGSVTLPKLSPTVYATQPEAEEGTDNEKLMTPLRVAQSTAVRVVHWATAAEALAASQADGGLGLHTSPEGTV